MTQLRHRPILHFIDTTGPGGGETVFLQVANGLRARGWPARVVLVGPGWVQDRAVELELPVETVVTKGRFDFGYLVQLSRMVRERDVQLVHAHLFSPTVYMSAIGAALRVPVVATFHGASDITSGGIIRRMKYWLIRSHARVVCVSESLSRQAVANARLRPDRLSVIHNGVDTERFRAADGSQARRELCAADSTYLVGAIGNIRDAKDYPTLIRAAAILAQDSTFAFAVAGERTEPLFSQLCELRDRMGLRDRMVFLGFRDDAAALINAFDTMVISSSTEGFSLAAVQAMAAGTPVVATRSGGPEDIITDGHDGLLVPTNDPPALANAVRRLRDDVRLREAIARNGRATAERRFSLDAMLDGYERLYRELLNPAGSARSRQPDTAVAPDVFG